MDLDQFLKHIYYTSKYIVVPVLNRMKIPREKFLNKRNKLDKNKINKMLTELYYKTIQKQ